MTEKSLTIDDYLQFLAPDLWNGDPKVYQSAHDIAIEMMSCQERCQAYECVAFFARLVESWHMDWYLQSPVNLSQPTRQMEQGFQV